MNTEPTAAQIEIAQAKEWTDRIDRAKTKADQATEQARRANDNHAAHEARWLEAGRQLQDASEHRSKARHRAAKAQREHEELVREHGRAIREAAADREAEEWTKADTEATSTA